MKRVAIIKILSLILLIGGLVAANVGCEMAKGGADIVLEGVTLGTMAMEGKTVAGIPSDKVNILLKVSADKVSVKTGPDGVTLSASPSGATVDIGSKGVSIRGVKPEQIQIEWPGTK